MAILSCYDLLISESSDSHPRFTLTSIPSVQLSRSDLPAPSTRAPRRLLLPHHLDTAPYPTAFTIWLRPFRRNHNLSIPMISPLSPFILHFSFSNSYHHIGGINCELLLHRISFFYREQHYCPPPLVVRRLEPSNNRLTPLSLSAFCIDSKLSSVVIVIGTIGSSTTGPLSTHRFDFDTPPPLAFAYDSTFRPTSSSRPVLKYQLSVVLAHHTLIAGGRHPTA